MIIAYDQVYIIGPGIPLGDGAGEENTGANVGAAFELFRDKTGVVLNFRTLSPDSDDFDTVQLTDEIQFELSETGVVAGTYPNSTVEVDDKGRVVSIVAGAAAAEYMCLQAECMGMPNNSIGYFSRATVDTSNPSGQALTSVSDQYQNGMLTPWLITGTWRIVDVKVAVAAAAVSITGVPDEFSTLRLDFYQVNVNNRTFIQTERLPCIVNYLGINVNNNLTPSSSLIYFAKDVFAPEIEPANSTLFGFEFVNESGAPDTINAFSRATAIIRLIKI